jgi:hypothetical protein
VSEQPERFFVSEIIRKHIFLQYRQEVPYGVAGAPGGRKDAGWGWGVDVRILYYGRRPPYAGCLLACSCAAPGPALWQ